MASILYDFSLIDNKQERRKALHDGNTDLYFDLWDRLTDARTDVAADIIELANDVGCVMVRATDGLMSKNGRRYYVHPSLYHSGQLQYTGWDQWGPTGHWHLKGASEFEGELPDRFVVSWK